MESSDIFSDNSEPSKAVKTLEDLVASKNEYVKTTGGYYEHQFVNFFGDFKESNLLKYQGREDLLREIARKTGSVEYRVSTLDNSPLKVHFFGKVIEVESQDYVTRSGLLFDPTLFEEGKTSSVVVNEYINVLRDLNKGVGLEVKYLSKGEWIVV